MKTTLESPLVQTLTQAVQAATVLPAATNDLDSYIQLIHLQKQLTTAIKAQEEQMLANHFSAKGDWGYITTAEKMNWKVTGDIDDYYLKSAPDTKKLKAAFDAGELPAGADFTTTVYLAKKIN